VFSPGYHLIATSSQVDGAVISGDGHYVVFWSCGGIAGVLAASCASSSSERGIDQVYETDLETGETSLVSAAEGGNAGNGWSGSAVVSQDGRYVAFFSDATNLEPIAAGSSLQLYERDMATGVTTLVSVNNSGSMGANAGPNGFPPVQPAISANGEYVAFATSATDLLAAPTSNEQVFERNTSTGVTTLISQGLGSEWITATQPAISADGRYVAFATSKIANFQGCAVAQRDTHTNTTRWVSGPANGLYCDGEASVGMSASGQFVGYNTNVLFSGGSVGDCGKYQGHATACIPAFETDLSAGSTQLVTSDLEGGLAGGLSGIDGVSENGQYVLAYSNAEDIVAEPILISPCLLTCRFGIYVFDQQTKTAQVLKPPTPEYPESYNSVSTAGMDEAGDRVAFVACPSVCQWVYIWNR
jgi:Tol biopolymer transport system component